MTPTSIVECTPPHEDGYDPNFCQNKCGSTNYVCQAIDGKHITTNLAQGRKPKNKDEVLDRHNHKIEKGKSYCLPVKQVETLNCNVFTGTRILSQGVDSDGNPTVRWYCDCDDNLKWTQAQENAAEGNGNCTIAGTDWNSCKQHKDTRHMSGNSWVQPQPGDPAFPWPNCLRKVTQKDKGPVYAWDDKNKKKKLCDIDPALGGNYGSQCPYCWEPSDAIVCPEGHKTCKKGTPWIKPKLGYKGTWDPKEAVCLCDTDNPTSPQNFVEHKVGNDIQKWCKTNTCYPGTSIDGLTCNCPAPGIWVPCNSNPNQVGNPKATTCSLPKDIINKIKAKGKAPYQLTKNGRDIRTMQLADKLASNHTLSYLEWNNGQTEEMGDFTYPCPEGEACAYFIPFEYLPKLIGKDGKVVYDPKTKIPELDIVKLNQDYPVYEWESYSACKDTEGWCANTKKCIRDSCNPVGLSDGNGGACKCTKPDTSASVDANTSYINSTCIDPCGPELNPCGGTMGTQGLQGTGNLANQVLNPQFLNEAKLEYSKETGVFGLPRGYCKVVGKGSDTKAICDPCYTKAYRNMTDKEYAKYLKTVGKKPAKNEKDQLCSFAKKTDYSGSCDNDDDCVSDECDEYPWPWSDKQCTTNDTSPFEITRQQWQGNGVNVFK